jgi:hypothetical protein
MDLVSELYSSKVSSRISTADEAAVAEIQRKHLRQYVAAALCCQKTEALLGTLWGGLAWDGRCHSLSWYLFSYTSSRTKIRES